MRAEGRATSRSPHLDQLHPHGPEVDHVTVGEVGGDDPVVVDERAVGAAVVQQPQMPSVANQNRVIAGDAVVVEADIRGWVASDVHHVAIEPQQSSVRPLAERQVLAWQGEVRGDGLLKQPGIEQRQRVEGLIERLGSDRACVLACEGERSNW